MVEPDRSLIERFAKAEQHTALLKDGGGGGTYDDMERRVTALEKAFEKLDSKLDILVRDVAYLKGKVDSLPTTLQLGGFIVAIFVAAGLTRYFGH